MFSSMTRHPLFPVFRSSLLRMTIKTTRKSPLSVDVSQNIVQTGPITLADTNSIRLSLLIKPNARRSHITRITGEYIGLAVAAQPREGEANKEVIENLAKMLGVRKIDVQIVAGHKAREKIVIVNGFQGGVEGALLALKTSATEEE